MTALYFSLQECNVVLSVSNPDQLSQCSVKLRSDNNNSASNCELTTPEDVQFTLEPKNEAFSLDDSLELDPDKLQYVFPYQTLVF